LCDLLERGNGMPLQFGTALPAQQLASDAEVPF
jgi:hypothetical protein